MHLAPLIRDLAVIPGVAGLISLLFQRIRQPVVLGYIIAGRAGARNLNPDSSFRIQEADLLWIAGEKSQLDLIFPILNPRSRKPGSLQP